MIEIEEALSRVLHECRPLRAISRPTIAALGQVLAEDVTADVDSPPHDKALVDGFAIRTQDAGRTLSVVEQIVAGAVPTRSVDRGTCAQVMTGAPIPDGAEAMVMVEQTEQHGATVTIQPPQVQPGEFIMPRGKVFSRGDLVLTQGTRIRAIEVGLLSEVGKAHVQCHRAPQVAILPTGDELVPCDHKPAPGQIRNSNGPMLEACVRRCGCEVLDVGVGRDDETELRRQIQQGLTADVFVLSGGVSAGVRDLVPEALRSLDVREIFHKVRLKPGKPLWFGSREHAAGRTLVFGLPGNPVSSFVCFELFVRPALRRLAGFAADPEPLTARLTEPFQQQGRRPTYHPGVRSRHEQQTLVEPIPWMGSADMVAICRADCLIHFPSGDRIFRAGENVEIFAMD